MTHTHRAVCRALLLLVLTLISLPIAAQTVTGTMRGTVTDRSAAALPGVTITIKNVETGLERVAVTGSDGSFSAPFLQIGRYNVQAELSGFATMKHNNVRVDLNETAVQEFVLDPATMTETVTVSADAPRVDVTDGEIKQTMRSQEIMTLPSASQTSFLGLAATFSGYQENPTSGQDNPTLSSGSSVNFNGAGTRGTTFQINGVNNDDSSENQHRQGVPLATIQSFQVLSNSFSAEFGRGYGAVVLVQTKQGTNSVDGELYGYAQDAKYNARSILQVSLQHANRHRRQYGVTAGFPIIRDRLFGFVNTDDLQDQGTATTTAGVFLPSDLDPSKRLTLGNDTPANRAWQDAIIARFPKATPNAPAIGTRAYQDFIDQNFPDRDRGARLDFNASMNNTLTARYQRTRQIRQPGELIIGEAAVQDNRQSNLGLTWTNILTSNTVQEARYGFGLRSTNVNISGGNDTPVVRMSTGVGFTFTILGNAGSFPIIRNQHDNQFVYNISTARWAKHTLKLGTDIRRSQLNDRADNFNRGFWNIGSTCGGVNYGTSIAAFWAGCVSSYQIAYGPNYLENKIQETNVYAQDDWRPFDNLVLNLGARYENVGAPKEDKDRINYGIKASDYIDPRLGFAYTPDWDRNRVLRALTGGNGRFSIRGGFGIYHGRVFQSIFSQGGASVRSNPPNAALLAFSNATNLADPTNGFVFDPSKPLTQRVSLALISPNLKMPETRQWNLTFERQAFWNSRLRLSYIGTLGKDLLQYSFDNLPVLPAPPGTQGAAWVVAQDWRCAGTGLTGAPKTTACPNDVPIAANEVSLRFPRTNDRRPNACCTSNLKVTNGSQSWYHAGQIEWESGEYHGFGGRMTYTYSKAIDEGSEATSVGTGDVNFFSYYAPLDYKRGLSRFDTRHRFTMVGSYRMPWLANRNDWVGATLGGWTLSTVVRLSSGTPFTIQDLGADDIDFDGAANQRPVCIDPKYCGGWHVNNRGSSTTEMPKSAYRHPVYGDTLSNLIGRNTFFSDGVDNVDAGLYKTFRLPASMSFMIRFDVFNVFNHETWGIPSNDFNAANFGTINSTSVGYVPRRLQLGFRLLY
ncbi:MAG TPA: TonB-dependent receptor [Thermoanaerobaculia bacterium]|nr:TonB-dependent receptor [Thermoanaerobaculia bacterium]